MVTEERETRRRILLVEDDPDLRENYVLALERAGFDSEAHGTVAAFREAFAASAPDVAILDVGLGADAEAGFDLCRSLRQTSPRLPILLLSARDSDLDIVSGLRLGADDYLTKDISLAQLVARVRTVLRRVDAFSQPDDPTQLRQIGPLRIDAARLAVRWRETPVELTVSEFRLVASLTRYPGQVRSRAQLMDAAELSLDEQTITAHIKRIRAKFTAIDATFSGIQTVYGLGYRWLERLDY